MKTYCQKCTNHVAHCACNSPPVDGVEFWFTPSDFSGSYRLRVNGDAITVLYEQDIWPGYEPASIIASTDRGPLPPYLERHKDGILVRAKYGQQARAFPRVHASVHP